MIVQELMENSIHRRHAYSEESRERAKQSAKRERPDEIKSRASGVPEPLDSQMG